jgi:vesicle-fusing ATPase
MAGRSFKVIKCPEVHSRTNRVAVNPQDWDIQGSPHIELLTAPGQSFIFSLVGEPKLAPGEIGVSVPQRKWAMLSVGQEVEIRTYTFDKSRSYISQVTLGIDYFMKKPQQNEEFNTDAMLEDFQNQFGHLSLTHGQMLAFAFKDRILQAFVKDIQCTDLQSIKSGSAVKPFSSSAGIFLPNSSVVFEKMEGAMFRLTGKSKGKVERQSIINPDWDFTKMGIGGLGTEFNAIFRRAFASRVFPPEIMEDLGCKHVKGILLYGPPGTGKTLMARQIGKMLNAREPKIVNGPEILDKYVGESEANIRKLFQEAEDDEKKIRCKLWITYYHI